MTQDFIYSLLCENIISAPIEQEIQKAKYNPNGIFFGLVDYLADEAREKREKLYINEVHYKKVKIGETIIIITHDLGDGEKFYSYENLYNILNIFGSSGWDIISTNTDYYYNDDEQNPDIEKRYFLRNILGVSDEYEYLLDKTLLTRNKYLLKKELKNEYVGSFRSLMGNR